MTKISDIYDDLHTLVSSALPGYVRMPNPYDPDQNSNLVIEKGYGIGFAPGVNEELELSCRLSVSRIFNVVLVNQITAFCNDATRRGESEKALFEDQFSLINIFEKNPTVNISGDTVKYLSDGGLEFLTTENSRNRYFLLESSFEARYFEQLT